MHLRRGHRGKWVLLGGIFLTILAGIGGYRWHRREQIDPVIKEKRLSAWLGELGPDDWRAASVVRQHDTNCLPLLFDLLNSRESRLEHFWRGAAVRLSADPDWRITAPSRRREKAVKGFQALGARAVTAIQPLEQLIRADTAPSQAVGEAFYAIGTNSIPVLLRLASDPSVAARGNVIYVLRRFEAQAERVLPTLEKLLSDPDPTVQVDAAWTIGFMPVGDHPPISALVNNLEHPRADVRRASLWALGKCGSNAPPALVAVQKCLNDHDPTVVNSAVNAQASILGEPPPNPIRKDFTLPPPDKRLKRQRSPAVFQWEF